jgi:hypothetical protein
MSVARVLATKAWFNFVLIYAVIVSADSYIHNCTLINNWSTYNGTHNYTIPSLSISNTNNIIADASNPWNLIMHATESKRLPSDIAGAGDIVLVDPTVWLDTNKQIPSGIFGCFDSIDLVGATQWVLNREVYERGVDDNGDCRTMLGTECVDALQRVYTAEAEKGAIRGECPEVVSFPRLFPPECQSNSPMNGAWQSQVRKSKFLLLRFVADMRAKLSC